MASVNKVILVGNLTKEPELRHTNTGTSVASFTVAINESYKDKNGDYKKSTTFLNVIAWGKTGEYAHKYLKKGAPVFIEGKIQVRNYENKEGQKIYVTEINASSIQSLSAKPSGDNAAGAGEKSGGAGDNPTYGSAADDGFFGGDSDDSVPF